MTRPPKLVRILKDTFSEWMDDQATTLAAALAYYTMFSVAPLLIIAVAVAGLVFGRAAVNGDIQVQLQGLVGPSGAKVIEDMMASASHRKDGILATIIGVAVLMFGASGVFAQLQQSLNIIWKAKPRASSGVLNLIRQRFLSFTMVLGIGFLLLVSLVLSAALAAMGRYLGTNVAGGEAVWHLVNLALSLGVVTLLFALIYKVLPDTDVRWSDVWLGALVTALLFSVGKLGIGLYLGKSTVASSYGAAGSVVIVLIWVYYSSCLLFLGAEFTKVFSRRNDARSQGKPSDSPPVKPSPEIRSSTWLPPGASSAPNEPAQHERS